MACQSSSMREYDDYVRELREQDPALAAQLEKLRALEHVLTWMKERSLSLATIDAVAQDEYSHDFLVPLEPNGRHLTFGMT